MIRCQHKRQSFIFHYNPVEFWLDRKLPFYCMHRRTMYKPFSFMCSSFFHMETRITYSKLVCFKILSSLTGKQISVELDWASYIHSKVPDKSFLTEIFFAKRYKFILGSQILQNDYACRSQFCSFMIFLYISCLEKSQIYVCNKLCNCRH